MAPYKTRLGRCRGNDIQDRALVMAYSDVRGFNNRENGAQHLARYEEYHVSCS